MTCECIPKTIVHPNGTLIELDRSKIFIQFNSDIELSDNYLEEFTNYFDRFVREEFGGKFGALEIDEQRYPGRRLNQGGNYRWFFSTELADADFDRLLVELYEYDEGKAIDEIGVSFHPEGRREDLSRYNSPLQDRLLLKFKEGIGLSEQIQITEELINSVHILELTSTLVVCPGISDCLPLPFFFVFVKALRTSSIFEVKSTLENIIQTNPSFSSKIEFVYFDFAPLWGLTFDPPTAACSPISDLTGRDWNLRAIKAGEVVGPHSTLPMAWDISQGGTNQRIGIIEPLQINNHSFLDIDQVFRMEEVNFCPEHVVSFAINSTTIGIHGTKVSGLAIGRTNPLIGTSGVAPNTKVFYIHQDVSSDSRFACAIGFAVRQNIRVINLSLGADYYENPPSHPTPSLSSTFNYSLINLAIEEAYDVGTVICAASGNLTDNQLAAGIRDDYIEYPACHPLVIACGASINASPLQIKPNSKGIPVEFWETSTAPGVTQTTTISVVAPGINLCSTSAGSVPNNNYAGFRNTSAATPQVSALVALMQHINPDLTPAKIRRILEECADLGGSTDPRLGEGLINAYESCLEAWACKFSFPAFIVKVLLKVKVNRRKARGRTPIF